MNRNVSAQISYDRLNKGVDIRNPSTAAFLIDSADRAAAESAANFTITPKGQNLFTGFFTRFGLTEIVLNWGIFNISPETGLTTFSFRVNSVNYTVSIRRGYYNVQQALDAMVVAMNAAAGAGTFSIVDSTLYNNCKALASTNLYYFINNTTENQLPNQLGFPTYGTGVTPDPELQFSCVNPNLSPYSYIDFTSPQLASQQDVKDSATSPSTPDSIYRWVFDEIPNSFDTYGYPILQCYKPFVQRRYLSFPKQIRWDPLIPLGQIQFRVLDNKGKILEFGFQNPFTVVNPAGTFYGQGFDFNMLMLVSEV